MKIMRPLQILALSNALILCTPAYAKDSANVAALRAELEALKAEQVKTAERIARVETMMAALETPEAQQPNTNAIPAPATPAPTITATQISQLPVASSAFDLSGDFRLRYESNFGDRDARNRDRAVLRARLRGSYTLTPSLTVGAQLTTGDPDDPNSSDITLSNFDDDLDVSLDQIWLRGRWSGLELTAGKIPQPFVRTDMVWDGDVSPEGLSATFRHPLGDNIDFKAAGLYFIIDESVAGKDSSMIGGQVTGAFNGSGPLSVAVSVGYFDYRLNSVAGGDAGDFRTNRFANGRYLSDFNLLDVIAKGEWTGFGSRWPVKLTGDYVRNFGATRGSEGFSLFGTAGRLSERGDVRFGYGYAEVGTDAVLAAFSEDNTTIATNVMQHNFSFDYALSSHLILNGTFYRFTPKSAIDAGMNAPDDWLNRLRINLLAEF
jgi:hypothetical protein